MKNRQLRLSRIIMHKCNALGVLINARKLIDNPQSWTQHKYARDSDGRAVPGESEQAVCWCAIGALQRVSTLINDKRFNQEASACLLAAIKPDSSMGLISVARYNDKHTHAEVINLFDEAINNEINKYIDKHESV